MLTKQEFGRQVLHIVVGLVTVLLYYLDIIGPFTIFLLLLVGGLASILSKRTWLPFFSYFLRNFEREEMRKTFPGRGLIFFFVGVLLVMKLFTKDIALASIMILALGDSVSHIVGGRFGRLKNIFNGHSRKLLEGTLAGAIVGGLGALLFVPIPEAFLGSLVAMIAEVIEIDLNKQSLDDNLIVPLVAGTVMFLLRGYL